MKIDSVAVCGFLFLDPVGHAQDTLFLTSVCLQQYCDGGSNPDELDGKFAWMRGTAADNLEANEEETQVGCLDCVLINNSTTRFSIQWPQ